MSPGVLSDIKVLDLTHYVAGPYCTKLLADYGADVVKIERPGGDGARMVGPFPKEGPHPEKSGIFIYLNTNKKGITLNLKNKTGMELFLELVKDCDILVENFEPRVMPSLGLSYDVLKAVNPRLVMLSISNFGEGGPYEGYKASSATMSAIGGATYITGSREQPLRLPGYLPLYMAGLQGFMSCLFAAYGGEGRRIDLSIAEAVASGLEAATILYSYTGVVRRRAFTRFMVGHPVGIYPCRDGHIVVIPGLGNMPLMALLVEQPELEDHPLFQSTFARQERPDEFDALILPWLMKHDRADILARAEELRMPFGVVNTIDEVAADPHLRERSYFVEIDHPEAGKQVCPGLPFKVAGQTKGVSPPPLLGEHNEEIFVRRMGFSEAQLSGLRKDGVI